MWIHEKDEVIINDQVFAVKAISGIYSTSYVAITLINEKTQEKLVYELIDFNKQVDDGIILKHKIATKATRSY